MWSRKLAALFGPERSGWRRIIRSGNLGKIILPLALPSKKTVTVLPAVWGNLVFLNSSADKGKTRKVICVDAETGKVNCSRAYPSKTHKTHRFNSFASSTPALDEQNVYSVWGHSTELKVCAHTRWENFLGKGSGRSQGRPWFRGFTHCFRRSSDRSQ